MKKLLLSISDSMVERNLLKTDFLSLLLHIKDLNIYIVCSDQKLFAYLQKTYGHLPLGIVFEPHKISKLDALLGYLARSSIHTWTVKELQRNRLRGWNSDRCYSLSLFLFCRACWYLGKYRWWRSFVRFLFKMKSFSYCKKLLENFCPDIVFVPSINSSDYELILQARRKGIKTIQMIKSWDNLSSKTFLSVFPDFLIVQNEVMKREAIEVSDMQEGKIFVSGVPQFDYLANNREGLLIDRKIFYQGVGIDPKKKIILFCASGDRVSPNDEDFLAMLNTAIQKGKIRNVYVLVRSHPKFINNWKQIHQLENVILERPFSYIGDNQKQWVFEYKDVLHWYNSIYHSSVVINVASSMSIDASILDRPTICLGFDGFALLPFEKSILRYYSRDHYVHLLETKGVSLVKSEQELIDTVNCYLKDGGWKRKERQKLVHQQCYQLDGNSSKRIVEFLREKAEL